MEVAYLKVTQRRNELGKIEQINYEWEGKSPYLLITRDFLDDFFRVGTDISRVQFGPYKLLRVENDYAKDTVLYVRADRFGALRVALYKATRLFDLMYRRMIITLAVWNLAEYKPYVIPSWRDIKLLKRFAK